MEYPNWHLTCSCGKSTMAKYDPKRGHYVTVDPKWKYTSKSNWTCGAVGHTKSTQQRIGDPEDEVDDEE